MSGPCEAARSDATPARASRAGRKGELHGNAVAALREMIISGQLAPGTRLKEVELGGALGISRTPLREALKVLASENLVSLLPNRSAVVAKAGLAEDEALYDVVATLEELAARRACERIGDEEIAGIAGLHLRMVGHHQRGEMPAYFEFNQEIHLGIVRVSGNHVLIETWERLRHRVRRARFLSNLAHDERWPEAVREHEEILAALTARDGDRLASLIRSHFINGLKALRADYGKPRINRRLSATAPQGG